MVKRAAVMGPPTIAPVLRAQKPSAVVVRAPEADVVLPRLGRGHAPRPRTQAGHGAIRPRASPDLGGSTLRVDGPFGDVAREIVDTLGGGAVGMRAGDLGSSRSRRARPV